MQCKKPLVLSYKSQSDWWKLCRALGHTKPGEPSHRTLFFTFMRTVTSVLTNECSNTLAFTRMNLGHPIQYTVSWLRPCWQLQNSLKFSNHFTSHSTDLTRRQLFLMGFGQYFSWSEWKFLESQQLIPWILELLAS